jgi:hypothetical protein
MAKITKNFTTNEMQCPCCDKCDMDEGFMISLQDVRSRCGFGFRVNSAYRCEEYNNKVSKNTRGQHVTGQAVDISMKDRYKRFKWSGCILMIDTLKTTGAGMGGWWLSVSGWLPEVISLCVGVATLVYLIIKIRKELK